MKKKKGFTLIEVTVSIALLSVIILFVVNFINLLRKNEDGISVDSKLYLNRELTSEYLNNDAKENGAATNAYCEDNICYIYYANGEARSLSIDETKTKLEFRNIGTDRTIYSKKIEEGYEYALELEQRANYYVLKVLVDNYPKYTTEMVIENGVSYVYWSSDDVEGTSVQFENGQIPQTTHQSISDLGFTEAHSFIRTTMVKNRPVKNESCIYMNQRFFCFDQTFYENDEQTTQLKLQESMQEALEIEINDCYTYFDQAYCYIGGNSCVSVLSYVYCQTSTDAAYVYENNSTHIYSYTATQN